MDGDSSFTYGRSHSYILIIKYIQICMYYTPRHNHFVDIFIKYNKNVSIFVI